MTWHIVCIYSVSIHLHTDGGNNNRPERDKGRKNMNKTLINDGQNKVLVDSRSDVAFVEGYKIGTSAEESYKGGKASAKKAVKALAETRHADVLASILAQSCSSADMDLDISDIAPMILGEDSDDLSTMDNDQ